MSLVQYINPTLNTSVAWYTESKSKGNTAVRKAPREKVRRTSYYLLVRRPAGGAFSSSWSRFADGVERFAVCSTMDVPSRKRVRNRTFAFVKRPSWSETTMNCEPLKRVRKSWPICCVCERSSAASI